MSKNSILFKPTTYIVLGIYITLAFPILAMGDKVVAAMLPEDHYFENVGAISLFVTSLLFLYGFRTARKSLDKTWTSLVKQLVYLGLALLFFFGAGEEISWGQRIFGFSTPQALAEVNKQDELNLHNLTVMENSKFFTADRMFDVFWFLFGVLTPAVALLVPAFRRFAGKFIPIVYWGMGVLFLYNYLWAKLAKIFFQAAYTFEKIPMVQAIQEVKESNYAVIFILVALYALWDLNKSQADRSVPLKTGTTKIEPVLDS
ncbi:MAG TPA: hypothetical protein VK206_08935 [Anaerolineales bacterium]|nr:hypothetical protein [Anaerolineales bacterium]HLO28650.1 hypothetical protein [Anaerolineales bacterium]